MNQYAQILEKVDKFRRLEPTVVGVMENPYDSTRLQRLMFSKEILEATIEKLQEMNQCQEVEN